MANSNAFMTLPKAVLTRAGWHVISKCGLTLTRVSCAACAAEAKHHLVSVSFTLPLTIAVEVGARGRQVG